MKTAGAKYIILLVLVAFILHIVWENIQAPLYEGFVSFPGHLSTCFFGAIGDIFITLFALLFISLTKQNFSWRLNKHNFIALAVIGFLISVLIEQRALLIGAWSYKDIMPIIPYFKVGLTPVLQMTLLLPLSFYITQKIYEKLFR